MKYVKLIKLKLACAGREDSGLKGLISLSPVTCYLATEAIPWTYRNSKSS